jgi:hypothetical protein
MDQKYVLMIIKKRFNFLLNEFNFKIVMENVTNSFDLCMTIFQSDKCKIRISYDIREEAFISVGPISALNVWSENKPNLWFDVWLVTKILSEKNREIQLWDIPSRARNIPFNEGVDKQLSDIAKKLRPLVPFITVLFNQKNFSSTHEKILLIQKNAISDMYVMVNKNN